MILKYFGSIDILCKCVCVCLCEWGGGYKLHNSLQLHMCFCQQKALSTDIFKRNSSKQFSNDSNNQSEGSSWKIIKAENDSICELVCFCLFVFVFVCCCCFADDKLIKALRTTKRTFRCHLRVFPDPLLTGWSFAFQCISTITVKLHD